MEINYGIVATLPHPETQIDTVIHFASFEAAVTEEDFAAIGQLLKEDGDNWFAASDFNLREATPEEVTLYKEQIQIILNEQLG